MRDAKKQLEIANSDDSHDEMVSALIRQAREEWERDTSRVTTQRAVTETFDQTVFTGNSWHLSQRPVISITTLKYYDTANAQQTLAGTTYSLDANNGVIHLAYDKSWPSTVDRWDCVEVIYTAGNAKVPDVDLQAMKLLVYLYFGDDSPASLDRYRRSYEFLVAKNQRSSYL